MLLVTGERIHQLNEVVNADREACLIRCRLKALSDLGLHCLPISHKKDARLIWVKHVF